MATLKDLTNFEFGRRLKDAYEGTKGSHEEKIGAMGAVARELLGQPDELTRVRADIDRTARVVQAYAFAIQHSDADGGNVVICDNNSTEVVLSWEEFAKEVAELKRLRSRERELSQPEDEKQDKREVDVRAVAQALAAEYCVCKCEAPERDEHWRSLAKVAIAAMGKQPARDVGELLDALETTAEKLRDLANNCRCADEKSCACSSAYGDACAMEALAARWRDGEKGPSNG
jgi:hypothetical protein